MPDRTCAHCGADFTPKRSDSSVCSKKCARLRWYYANRQHSIETTRAWHAAHDREWRQTKRAWGLANRERKLEALRRFYLAHPDAVVVYSNRRRERKLMNTRGLGVSERDITRLVNRFAGRCAYCGAKPPRLHIDHVMPLARGGSNDIGNLLPACPDCNLSKNRKTIMEWRVARGLVLAA